VRFIGIFGLIALMGIGYLMSNNRRKIPLRVVFWGLSLQFLMVIIILGSRDLSWAGLSVFLYLILLYIYQHRLVGKSGSAQWVVPMAMIAAGGVIAVMVGIWLAGIGILSYALLASIAAIIIAVRANRPVAGRFAISGLIAGSFAWMIHGGIAGQGVFLVFSDQVTKFLKLTDKGTVFLFGNLAKPEYFFPNATTWPGFGYQFAFAILPTIIFFSAFMSILYYLGIMQFFVELMARFMKWTMRTSGSETLSCAANIFVGQTEAPLLIRPFLDDLTISELHCVMVGGFATIAGGVMAGYIRMGVNAGHLIAASVMSAPAALVMAKIILPETGLSKTAGDATIPRVSAATNILDAAARGVTDGLKLAANVGAMLIAFLALLELADVILAFGDKMIDGRVLGHVAGGIRGEYPGIFPGSLRTLFGTILAPLAFSMGVAWKEAAAVGNLLGIEMAANEFVAYGELSMQIAAGTISHKAATIATYALCGFANFGSIGIQLGGIGALAPGRRSDLAKVGLRAMIGGALASWMTAAIAGMLV
jgi:CNT family concentrative nucleoside transporter